MQGLGKTLQALALAAQYQEDRASKRIVVRCEQNLIISRKGQNGQVRSVIRACTRSLCIALGFANSSRY
eukprot:4954740-Amphidinium_carterae.1